MMMITIAWKNIWRNKKRSLIILIATAIGLAAGLLTVGITTGLYEAMVSSGINRETGNIQLHTSAYKKDQMYNQYIRSADSVVRMLRSIADVRSVATHSVIEGMASSATTASGVMIFGIRPEDEREVTAVAQCMIDGSYLEIPNSVIIGKKLAEKLKLKLRTKLVLSFSGPDGNIIYGAFRISGIYRTDASTFDAANVFIRREDLAALVGSEIPVHEITLRTRNAEMLEETRAFIRRNVPQEIVVETWKELAPELKLTADSTDIVNTVLLGIFLFALLFGLTNTLMMSVLDRIRDFGVLLAIGLYRRRLFSMIILESLFLSCTGGIVGVIFGWGITTYFLAQGIDLTIISTGLSAFGIPTMLYPHIRDSVYLNLAVMMVSTSVIAALYPAIKAVRLKPVEAIRSIG